MGAIAPFPSIMATVLRGVDADRGPPLSITVQHPPAPLPLALEAVADLDGGVVVQVTDRVPRNLFPRLDDRGFASDPVERDGRVVTVLWRA